MIARFQHLTNPSYLFVHLVAYLTGFLATVYEVCGGEGGITTFTYLNYLHLYIWLQVSPSSNHTRDDVMLYLSDFLSEHYTLTVTYSTPAIMKQAKVLAKHARWNAFYLEMFNRYGPKQFKLQYNTVLDANSEAESDPRSGGRISKSPSTKV
jgi:hypothetical protein